MVKKITLWLLSAADDGHLVRAVVARWVWTTGANQNTSYVHGFTSEDS